MQVKKQDINVGKAVFEGEIKSSAEGSIIVPDVKPDILKVLQVDAETYLTEKTIDTGKLILKGNVCVNVLYVPENDKDHVQSINGCFEFCETVKRPEFDQDMNVIAFCDSKKVGYKLINSRKIGIEAYIGINVNVSSKEHISFICEIDEEKCESCVNQISIKEACITDEFTFNVDDTVEIPCADAFEILKSNVTVIDKEYRTITGKVIIKGKASANILYVTENGIYEHIGFELPFTEVFDADDINEECECDVTYNILKTEFKFVDNVNGNGKCVSANIEIQVNIGRNNCTNFQCIADCYFIDSDCEIKYAEIECEELQDSPFVSKIIKQGVEKNDNLPDISKIYTSVAKPYISSTDIQNGHIDVSGKVTVYILYMSDDPKHPLSCLTEEIPFTHTIDSSNISKQTDVLLNIECEHISCTISNESNVEIRCGICIKGKIVNKYKVNVINEITLTQIGEKDKSIIIYFVKKGETLWDIGKRYHIKRQDICEYNNLREDDILLEGQKIIIPVIR